MSQRFYLQPYSYPNRTFSTEATVKSKFLFPTSADIPDNQAVSTNDTVVLVWDNPLPPDQDIGGYLYSNATRDWYFIPSKHISSVDFLYRDHHVI
jgi:hypothetical protein